jgi:hypothetical protein
VNEDWITQAVATSDQDAIADHLEGLEVVDPRICDWVRNVSINRGRPVNAATEVHAEFFVAFWELRNRGVEKPLCRDTLLASFRDRLEATITAEMRKAKDDPYYSCEQLADDILEHNLDHVTKRARVLFKAKHGVSFSRQLIGKPLKSLPGNDVR